MVTASNEKGCRPFAAGGGTHGTGAGMPAHAYHTTKPVHGQVAGDTWHKRVCASRHFLRKPPAICVDIQDFGAAERAGARFLCIQDLESGRCYWATLRAIRAHGFALDRGHGEQVALSLRRWTASKTEAALAAAEQMALWGG